MSALPRPVSIELKNLLVPFLRDWRRFLEQTDAVTGKPLLPGGRALLPSDASLGQMMTATRQFQGLSGLDDTGALDKPTVALAMQSSAWPRLWFGPDAGPDLRRQRPYFLVPILDAAFPFETEIVMERILRFASTQQITDVHFVSHGWHRNLFGAVAAYDRLLSRFSVLRARERLDEVVEPGFMEAYRPLFIAFHWNSDPGESSWEDRDGRRSKDDFMERCRGLFVPGKETNWSTYAVDFENLFEFMAVLSGLDTITEDPEMRASSGTLTLRLNGYAERDVSKERQLTLPEKVSCLWRCYFESKPLAVLKDQEEKPSPTGNAGNAIITLVKFVAPFMIGWLLTKFPALLKLSGIPNAISSAYHAVKDWLPASAYSGALAGLLLYLGALAAAYLLLFATKSIRQFAALFWIPAQLLASLPILLILLFAFVFRLPFAVLLLPMAAVSWPATLITAAALAIWSVIAAWKRIPIPNIFPERLRTTQDKSKNFRDFFADMARLPIRWMRSSYPSDSIWCRIGGAIDNQLAFFEMQRKGVDSGREAGLFAREMLTSMTTEQPLRVHFAGHSFGGSVVVNALRTLVQEETPEYENKARKKIIFSQSAQISAMQQLSGKKYEVQSVVLIQAAIASGWFRREEPLLKSISGCLANVHSAYDTANGFWYPVANNGRMAAGFVGLCDLGDGDRTDPVSLGKGGAFTMLVRPPNLASLLRRAEAPATQPIAVNLDASRLIYAGAPITGGGHGDIFKDDVVNLIWSAMWLGR